MTSIAEAAPEDVQLLPRYPEPQAVDLLADCNLLYLPFWYDNALMNRTSNPSKLCMYLPAARPLIIHGPEDSVPVRWAREQGIGTIWTTRDPKDFPEILALAIAELDNWPALRARYQQLFAGPLSLDQRRQQFWQMMAATLQDVRYEDAQKHSSVTVTAHNAAV
jgi:hypothetical protein